MRVLFTRDLFDSEGDLYEKCILLHFDNNLILKIKDSSELDDMIIALENIKQEIEENG